MQQDLPPCNSWERLSPQAVGSREFGCTSTGRTAALRYQYLYLHNDCPYLHYQYLYLPDDCPYLHYQYPYST